MERMQFILFFLTLIIFLTLIFFNWHQPKKENFITPSAYMECGWENNLSKNPCLPIDMFSGTEKSITA